MSSAYVRSRFAALILVVALGALLLPPARASAGTLSPVMGRSVLTAGQLSSWYASTGHTARMTVPMANLAQYYISEGAAEGIRGDLAFAQSIVETAYFYFPDYGQVRPGHNNFAGIGAVDGGNAPNGFRSAQIGVRAQIQHLRAYADPTVTPGSLAYPLESPRFNLVSPKGKAPYWERMGGGNWASDPAYAGKVLAIYGRILAHAAVTPTPQPTTTTPLTAVEQRYAGLDAATRAVLGAKVGGEFAVGDGRGQAYANGRIYWSSATGARVVMGAISALYVGLGGPEALGFPISDEYAAGTGRASNFQAARIYWLAGRGAHAVVGAILAKYLALGGPASPLGLPLTNEVALTGGQVSTFERGRVYWRQGRGASAVYGLIYDKYRVLGAEAGALGWPTSDEFAVTGGRANSFDRGEIYWSRPTGPRALTGAIAVKYRALGGPGSALGLPTSDWITTPTGLRNTFVRGGIAWTRATNLLTVTTVPGSVPGKACPQAQPRRFTNDWGAPRVGHTHQGTDVFGAMGGNVFAITGGTIEWTRPLSGSAGNFLSLKGDDGHRYWYMHLRDFVTRPGQRVAAGQLVGHNGDTGNAKGMTPHVHFEYHPNGGVAVNPYPLLKSICG